MSEARHDDVNALSRQLKESGAFAGRGLATGTALRPGSVRAVRKRRRLSLALILNLAVATTVLGASGAVGYYALTIVYQNKLIDTWAIMFLELERQGTLTLGQLRGVAHAERSDQVAIDADPATREVLVTGTELRVLRGAFSGEPNAADLGLDKTPPPAAWPSLTVLEHSGELLVARLAEAYKPTGAPNAGAAAKNNLHLLAWPLPSDFFDQIFVRGARIDGAVYLMTREGRLIYATDPAITPLNVVAMPLVQHFINAPLSQGQVEFRNRLGQASYGFYYEVPHTNIVMFVEVTKAKALASIQSAFLRYIGIVMAILLAAIALVQIPLTRITAPLGDLAKVAKRLGAGDFTVKVNTSGFGELGDLSRAFAAMATNLIARDKAIQSLMAEQVLKMRLEGELKVAQGIQQNLLPAEALPKDCGTEVAAVYQPASECAGDWYNFCHNPRFGETVVAVVDVSGHGAGSSMFTAMIAGIFSQFKNRQEAPFDMPRFAAEVNVVLGDLGRRQWHATMVLVKHHAMTGEIELLSTGHLPPLLQWPKGADATEKPKFSGLGSAPLGLGEATPTTTKRYKFPRGASLLLYTDGLIEAVDTQQVTYGKRRLIKAFQHPETRSPRQVVHSILDDWRRHCGRVPAGDDVCLVMIKAS